MAKTAKVINKRDVADWFAGQPFEVQQSVLDDFTKAHDLSKEQRITALEKEIASLRSGAKPIIARSANRRGAMKGTKVEPKYRHPETGETWAGRGVQPTWMRAYLKKRGNKIETLLIKK